MAVLPLALLAFLFFGVLLVLPGALQPVFAAGLGLDLAQSAGLASALLAGVGIGVLASGPLVDRFARRPLFAAAALACAAALAGAATASSFAALAAMLAAAGVASGAYETLLNAAVPESNPARAAARLSFAHAAATIGAALGAPLLAAAAAAIGAPRTLAALAGAFALLALAGTLARFPAPPRRGPALAIGAAPLPLRALAPLALASAAYVGVETATSVMLPPLARASGLAAARGTGAISAFWAGILVARLAFARLGLPARPREIVLGSGAAALALGAGALVGVRALELWSAAVGFALGAVFPVLVVLSGDIAPERRATALALVVAAGSIGGFALPWLAGSAGALHAPLVLGAGCALIALGAGAVPRAARHPQG
jgi:MFS family permease